MNHNLNQTHFSPENGMLGLQENLFPQTVDAKVE